MRALLHLVSSDHIITFVIAFVSGILGTFIAPWVHWRVDVRRQRLQLRREQVARWRQMLERVVKEEQWRDPGELEMILGNEVEFLSLKPYLSQKTLAMFDDNELLGSEIISQIVLEVGRVEKKWHLI